MFMEAYICIFSFHFIGSPHVFPGGPVGGKESEDEDSAAYCDYIRWKRTLGEGEGNAEKLRSHNGREECGDGLSGGT